MKLACQKNVSFNGLHNFIDVIAARILNSLFLSLSLPLSPPLIFFFFFFSNGTSTSHRITRDEAIKPGMIEGRAPKAEIERELNFTLIARTLIWFGRFGRVVQPD